MKADQVWIDVPIAPVRDGMLPLVSIASGRPGAELVGVTAARAQRLWVPLCRDERQFKVLGPLSRVVVAVMACGGVAVGAAYVGYAVGASDPVDTRTWLAAGAIALGPALLFSLLLGLDPPTYRVRLVEGGTRVKLLVHQGFVDAVLPPRPTSWLARWKPGPYNYRGRGAAVLTTAGPVSAPGALDVIDLRGDD